MQKKYMILQLIICYLIFQNGKCTIGVDVSTPVDASKFTCMKNNGVKFAIARGYHSNGQIDVNAKATIEAAASVGLNHDTYHFPCIGKVSPTDQANAHVNYLGNLPGMYWIDFETNSSPGCGWKDPNTNCIFLQDLVKAFEARGVKVGIYASHYMWTTIFGNADYCPQFTHLGLWYADYDKVQSFADYKPFGGWTKPNIKQYQGTSSFCGASVDLSWYP